MRCHCQFLILIVLAITTSCSNSLPKFDYSGGELKYGVSSGIIFDEVSQMTDHNTQLILSQVYEGLVSFHPKDLNPQPQLASSYQVSDDGLVYSFTLRENVNFVSPDGQTAPLKPSDVVYTVMKACSPKKGLPSKAFHLVFSQSLKGAEEFFQGKAKSISGLSIKGNSISFHLKKKDHLFLNRMGMPICYIVSEELDKSSKEFCGTGPFTLRKGDVEKDEITLKKNESYYIQDSAGNQLPYLDKLTFAINQSKMGQLEDFESNKTQIITGLPPSRITQMLEGRLKDFNSDPPLFNLHNTPQLKTNYIFFNLTDPRFENVKVRQAFNYAVNRVKLGQQILNNQYYELGFYGIVPPVKSVFKGYDFEGVRSVGYSYNEQKAKQLFQEAGYKDGKSFGTVQLRYVLGEIESSIADEIANQLNSVLGLTVNLDACSIEDYENEYKNGNGHLFLHSHSAEYPSADSFLLTFHGRFVPKNKKLISPINLSRFSDSEFDRIMDASKEEKSLAKRRKLQSDAEKILLKKAPIIALYYSGEIEISYSRVRQLVFNPMQIFSFKSVYLKEWSKDEYLDSQKK